VRLCPRGTSATDWPILSVPDDRWVCSSQWDENCQWKPKYSEKTCRSATLSTTNPTWPDLVSNSGGRCAKPATNSLSYGTAWDFCHFIVLGPNSLLSIVFSNTLSVLVRDTLWIRQNVSEWLSPTRRGQERLWHDTGSQFAFLNRVCLTACIRVRCSCPRRSVILDYERSGITLLGSFGVCPSTFFYYWHTSVSEGHWIF
jgi:hypothetical protein